MCGSARPGIAPMARQRGGSASLVLVITRAANISAASMRCGNANCGRACGDCHMLSCWKHVLYILLYTIYYVIWLWVYLCVYVNLHSSKLFCGWQSLGWMHGSRSVDELGLLEIVGHRWTIPDEVNPWVENANPPVHRCSFSKWFVSHYWEHQRELRQTTNHLVSVLGHAPALAANGVGDIWVAIQQPPSFNSLSFKESFGDVMWFHGGAHCTLYTHGISRCNFAITLRLAALIMAFMYMYMSKS